MAQSQNTKVEFTIRATSMHGLTTYGNVLVGDKAFEFYNERNPEDFIQIPWDEVDYVSAEVLPGKHIARFAIFTYKNGRFIFSTRDNKATLRAVREHVPADRLLKSLNFFQIVGHGIMFLPHLVRDKLSGRKDAGGDDTSADASGEKKDGSSAGRTAGKGGEKDGEAGASGSKSAKKEEEDA